MATLLRFCLVLCFLIQYTSCKKDIPDSVDVKSIMDVAYGASAEQKMDVYLPANRTANTPVIILLHGGGFVAGDKNEFTLQSKMLSAKGYAVLNLNYRLVDTIGMLRLPPIHRPSSITINNQVADIKSAVNFASGKAAEWMMNSQKWGICGHSAGATLAMLAAYNYGSANADKRIAVVANWAGATDLSFNDESEYNNMDPRLAELYYRAVGFEPRNVNKLAYMAVSPVWNVYNGNGIPTLNIRPEFNNVFNMPDASKNSYQVFTNTLNNKGIPNKWIEVAGADHGFGQPGNWELVVNETANWFEKYVR